MFRSLSFVGVASAAIIESRPHEHLQMANAQLQNATEAVIKTAAVAGLAYAGAYMAAAGTTPGAYDSSRRSQASSTGSRYCDTREADPLKYKCTAEFFNGNKVNNAAENQAKVAIRNYWCCPAQDLGGKYIGDMNGVCLSQNNGAAVFAQDQGAGGCTYHGPCIAGVTAAQTTGFISGFSVAGTNADDPETGNCGSTTNLGTGDTITHGIFGGVPGGYNQLFGTAGGAPGTAGDLLAVNAVTKQGGINLGPSSGLAYANGVPHGTCCVLKDQGKGGSKVYDLTPATLVQPISFCAKQGFTNSDYTCED